MHVLLVIPYVDNPYGGPETVAYYLLSGFRSILKGSDIDVTVLSTSPRCREVQLSDNIRVKCLRIPKPITISAHIHIKKYLDKLDIVPDIIHTHDIFFAYSASPNFGDKIIYTIHGLLWKEREYSNSVPFKISTYVGESELKKIVRTVRLTAISRYVKKELSYRFGLSPQAIKILYDPISDDYFSIKRKPSEGIIFYPASIIPRKNQLLLLKVAKLLKNETQEFKIIFTGRIGDSKYYSLIRDYIKKNKLERYVLFMGEVPKSKILSLWSLTTVGIIPSLEETFSLSLVEGLASGTPMLSSPVGVAPEVILPGKTGFFIDPHDPFDVADKLRILLEDKTLRKKIGKRGRKISWLFHSKNIALETLKLWRDVYEERG